MFAHSASYDSEAITGPFPTREEAIEDGRTKYVGAFWLWSCSYVDPARFLPDVDHIAQCISDNASDELDDVGDWPNLSPEAKAELGGLMAAWANKHIDRRLWGAVDRPEKIEPVDAEEDRARIGEIISAETVKRVGTTAQGHSE